jgi:hypothetical protein
MKKVSEPIKWESSLFDWDYEADVPLVRIHNQMLTNLSIKRGDWVEITSTSTQKRIYRIARGSGRIKGLDYDTIMIDRDGVRDLDVKHLVNDRGYRTKRPASISYTLVASDCSTDHPDKKMECDVYSADWTIRKAPLLKRIVAHCSHPNFNYRIPIQIAFVSLFLGVLGFFVGCAGLIISIISLTS